MWIGLRFILALHCALAIAAVAQTEHTAAFGTPRPQPCSGNLTTVGQCLREHNIPLTKDGLLSALHSQDTEIWSLAAEELAIEGMKDAIPDLARLLDAKSDPNERIILANSLAQLGDDRGVQTLRSYCDDTAVSMGNRLEAANQLLRWKPESCSKTLIEGLQDSSFRAQALGMVPGFKDLSPSESSVVKAILLKSLQDQDFMVRLQAAEAIEGLSDITFAIAALQAAIPKESNPEVRSAMGYSLERLQSKQQATARPTTP
jgi:HEAT repeat protein